MHAIKIKALIFWSNVRKICSALLSLKKFTCNKYDLVIKNIHEEHHGKGLYDKRLEVYETTRQQILQFVRVIQCDDIIFESCLSSL